MVNRDRRKKGGGESCGRRWVTRGKREREEEMGGRRGDKKGKEKTRGRREEEKDRGGRVKREWREMQETTTLDTSTHG